jgi:hypothetical protein
MNDVEWAIEYLHDGTEVTAQPTINFDGNGNKVPETLLREPFSSRQGGQEPRCRNLHSMGAFNFQSGNTDRGVYYVMTLNVRDKNTGEVEDFAFMFDIPYSGQNRMYCSAEKITDAKGYYSTHSKELTEHEKEQVFTKSVRSASKRYELVISYDSLKGKNYMPDQDKDKYYYQSMVVLKQNVYP